MITDFGGSVDVSDFWQIRRDLNSSSPIVYVNSIKSNRCTGLKSTTLKNFMSLLSSLEAPVVYEVLETNRHFSAVVNLYFDVDHEIPLPQRPAHKTVPIGAPLEGVVQKDSSSASGVVTKEDELLERILNFLRSILGQKTVFAVSKAHRPSKISFHIVCPYINAPLSVIQHIAKLAEAEDLPVDTAVYKKQQLMRPLGSIGEKSDSVRLVPVSRYMGVFSDHLIQAVSPYARTIMTTTSLPPIEPKPYKTDGSLWQEVINNIPFAKLSSEDKNFVEAYLKVKDNFPFYVHKMRDTPQAAGISFKKQLKNRWNYIPHNVNFHRMGFTSVGELSSVLTDRLCNILVRVNPDQRVISLCRGNWVKLQVAIDGSQAVIVDTSSPVVAPPPLPATVAAAAPAPPPPLDDDKPVAQVCPHCAEEKAQTAGEQRRGAQAATEPEVAIAMTETELDTLRKFLIVQRRQMQKICERLGIPHEDPSSTA